MFGSSKINTTFAEYSIKTNLKIYNYGKETYFKECAFFVCQSV